MVRHIVFSNINNKVAGLNYVACFAAVHVFLVKDIEACCSRGDFSIGVHRIQVGLVLLRDRHDSFPDLQEVTDIGKEELQEWSTIS